MTFMDLRQTISDLTDRQVIYCLNALIEARLELDAAFQAFVASPELTHQIVRAADRNSVLPNDLERSPALRAVLFALADDTELALMLGDVIESKRSTLSRPIVPFLGSASLLLLLSLSFRIDFETKTGETKIEFHAKKESVPLPKELIAKVIGFLR